MRRMLFNLLERRIEKLLTPHRDGIAAAAVADSGGVALLGDSITHMGRWDLLFPNVPTRNFGISGETSAQLLARLAPVISVRPSLVLILIGTNDLFWGFTPEEAARNVAAIISQLKTALPDATIVLQAVMPRAAKYMARVRALNSLYAQLAEQAGVTWLDLFPVFDDGSGCMRAELTHDNLHLLGAGYDVWKGVLAPLVAAHS